MNNRGMYTGQILYKKNRWIILMLIHKMKLWISL